MLRSTLLAVSRNHRVRDAAVAFAPTRAVVQRFVAGETLDDCVRVCRELVADGLYATVDHLGEDTTTRAQAEATARAYLDLLARLDAEGLADRVEVSVKLSALGQAVDAELTRTNVQTICAAAAAVGTTVTFDAEDHTTTDDTLGMLREIRDAFPTTGGVLQAYLRRTPDDCRALSGPGSRIRLCKGAYDEPESVALRDPAAVDAAYLACLRILFKGEGYPMVASHDPRMIEAALGYADLLGRGPGDFELQMLHGVRSEEQRRLAAAGHTVRVYVPYGTDWYGYFVRRLAERPANLLFLVRALVQRT